MKENEPSKNELKLPLIVKRLAQKKNVRLLKDRESADYRVGLEMKRAVLNVTVDENYEYRYD